MDTFVLDLLILCLKANNFIKNDDIIFKMVESINTSNLNNQQFRLNNINEIENYFIPEIKERGEMS